ncbi:hypothetical protein Cgig2_017123 [Carnegiea gigantea]|uniref:Uncharacterized protein n=1 Tax=Carnegiea gigantea TaxID=171969 RepID=A0A9Q1K3M9_9CARY|nr:hypothetical protein Cgig2_017123 [Carnegiea gigantea]
MWNLLMVGAHPWGFKDSTSIVDGLVATDHRAAQCQSSSGAPSMAFSCSLSTGEMAEYVVYHFEWDRREVTFPPLPFPNDFQALCPSYELAMAEEAARWFELLELPQVIFYRMLLNEAQRLGVLYGRILCIMELALTELRLRQGEAEKKDVQCQLKKALFKVEAEVLVTLAQEFQEDAYIEAYLHYIDERRQADAEGQDLEEVKFIPPSGKGDGPGDEATNPLDAEAGTPEDEGREDSGEPDL